MTPTVSLGGEARDKPTLCQGLHGDVNCDVTQKNEVYGYIKCNNMA